MLGTTTPALDALLAPRPGVTPPAVAVVQPVSADSLTGIIDAVDRGLVRALLVGSRERIVARLRELGRREGDFEIEHAEDDRAAACAAVELVRGGRADILMKGHLHSDDFLRPAVGRARGLRGSGRMSHAFVCYLPESTYHKPLVVTDAAMNIAPDLDTKVDIAANAIELVRVLGTERPKMAVLAAVETVNAAMEATADAAALQELARRGAFGAAIIEGPLAFDNAISREAAATKGIASQVAGDPDILCVPDIEAGNILYKSMVYLCGAITPGVILGGSAPLLLTSRADPPLARTASCALAARLVNRARR
ncbi:MAG TPA: bifunctional enoyl-CoA hydratase/phosphate acetyltransferase [Candidatus Dormibacteraeota bacterium]|nr:bifunctional enoyl-CoA hydratase/phosphate acetyltransferase [Candidatus Dormibacteraeota bacterium]